jgi:hypothetical protein
MEQSLLTMSVISSRLAFSLQFNPMQYSRANLFSGSTSRPLECDPKQCSGANLFSETTSRPIHAAATVKFSLCSTKPNEVLFALEHFYDGL